MGSENASGYPNHNAQCANRAKTPGGSTDGGASSNIVVFVAIAAIIYNAAAFKAIINRRGRAIVDSRGRAIIDSRSTACQCTSEV